MKKKDLIQLVKESVEEVRAFYGSHDNFQPTGQRRNLSGLPGVMEEEYTARDQWEDFDDKEKAEVLNALGKDGYNIIKLQGYVGYDEILDNIMKGDSETFDAVILGTPLKEFKQPKSFDPDTISLVREMLSAADVYHNDLVDSNDEVSSYLGKRSGGTYFIFPHYNGPGGRGALFGRGTVDRIDRSKAAAKAAALKTYTKFKTYIEDYEITDKSPAGVAGKVYLFVMFNNLAKDYSAPKGGTQSSQFETIDEEEVHGKEIVITASGLQNALTFIGKNLKNLSSSMLSRLLGIFNVKDLKTLIDIFPHNIKDLKPKLKRMTPEEAKTFGLELNKFHTDMKRKNMKEIGTFVTGRGGQTKYMDIDNKEAQKMKSDPNITDIDTVTGMRIKEEPNEISYDDAKKKGLKNPDKADISKDKDISDYELKRGMAIQKAMDDQEKNEGHMDLTNDIGKDDYVDDEGRYAKSQLYKMGKYAMKLHDKLDDMEQLPAWLQSKLTKASDYVSMVYHYLDYEFARRGDNLMEHVDKYNKRAQLMEGAMKRFFKMFDEGMTDEEVVLDYAQRGTQVPENFVNKARKQYEGLKKMKLELEMSEKEYKNTSSNVAQPTPEITGMEDIEEKKLASGLSK